MQNVGLNRYSNEYGITVDEAIQILNEASSGIVTFDDRFKSACKLGWRIIIEVRKDEGICSRISKK